MLNIEWCNTWK